MLGARFKSKGSNTRFSLFLQIDFLDHFERFAQLFGVFLKDNLEVMSWSFSPS